MWLLLDAQAAVHGAFSLNFLSPLWLCVVRADGGAIDILLQHLVLMLILGRLRGKLLRVGRGRRQRLEVRLGRCGILG